MAEAGHDHVYLALRLWKETNDAVEVLKLGRVRLDGVGANELHRLIERFRATVEGD